MDLTAVLSYVFFFVMGLLIFVVGIPFLFVMNRESNEPKAVPQKRQSEPPVLPQSYAQNISYYVPAPQQTVTEYIPVQEEYAPVEMYSEEKSSNFNPRLTGPKYEIINAYTVPQQVKTKLKTWESNWN